MINQQISFHNNVSQKKKKKKQSKYNLTVNICYTFIPLIHIYGKKNKVDVIF